MSLSEFKIRFTVSLLTVLTILLLLTSAGFAQKGVVKSVEPASGSGFEAKEYDIGIVLGLWLPGTIAVEDIDLDKSAGPLVRVFADAYLMPKFAVGGYFNYSTATLEYSALSLEADADFYEFGIALKPRFLVSPVVAIKPGLNIGYRKSTRENLGGETAETDADGLGLNLSVEVQYLVDSDYIIFFEGGFLSQPTGGNADADVTWAPIIYLAAGICF